MAIRALDYAPPVNIGFGEFLSALLTADVEVAPDDTKYQYRAMLRRIFVSYGISSAATTWTGTRDLGSARGRARIQRTHFESMRRDLELGFAPEMRRCTLLIGITAAGRRPDLRRVGFASRPRFSMGLAWLYRSTISHWRLGVRRSRRSP
jgi:hypothetical protein